VAHSAVLEQQISALQAMDAEEGKYYEEWMYVLVFRGFCWSAVLIVFFCSRNFAASSSEKAVNSSAYLEPTVRI